MVSDLQTDGPWLVERVLPAEGPIPLLALGELRSALDESETRRLDLAYVRRWLPIDLWYAPADEVSPVACSDAHVHHGGMFQFNELVSLSNAFGSDIADALPDATTLHRYRIASRLLGEMGFVRSMDRLPAVLRGATDQFRSAWQSDRVARWERPPAIDPFAFRKAMARAVAPPADPDDACVVICAATWLYSVLHPAGGTGFDQFQQAFERRWCELGDPPYDEVVRRFGRAGVSRLEIRKNAGFSETRAFEDVNRLIDRVARAETPLTVSFPISISRHGLVRSTGAPAQRMDGATPGHQPERAPDVSAGRPPGIELQLHPTEWVASFAPDRLRACASLDVNGSEPRSAPS